MKLENPKIKIMINSLSFFDDEEPEVEIHNWENEGGKNLSSDTEIKINPKKMIDEFNELKKTNSSYF